MKETFGIIVADDMNVGRSSIVHQDGLGSSESGEEIRGIRGRSTFNKRAPSAAASSDHIIKENTTGSVSDLRG